MASTLTAKKYKASLCSTLDRLRPTAIAVYGLGVVAKDVVSILEEYNVVGLLDKSPANEGGKWFGLTVLTERDLEQLNVDAIVIAASDVYWSTISLRIAPICSRLNIQIIYLDGGVADTEDKAPSFWKVVGDGGIGELETAALNCDVISFDLFETLVTRAFMRHDDLLELAASHALKSGHYEYELLSLRKKAEFYCINKYGIYCFQNSAIYTYLENYGNLPKALVQSLVYWEQHFEVALSTSRDLVVDFMNKCLNQGIKVCITTDTHLSKDVLINIFQHCNIPIISDIYISWDFCATKSDGSMFDVLKKRYPSARILHIGDNYQSDNVKAKECGLRSFWLSSPLDVFMSSRWGALLTLVRTAEDGILLGLIVKKLFSNRLENTVNNGKVCVDDLRYFGYVFIGPLMLAWMNWLVSKLRLSNPNKLLFLAREGYYFCSLYNQLRDALGWKDLPQGIYFPTSRRMATVAAIATEEDAFRMLEEPFSGSSQQLLRVRFGLSENIEPNDDFIVNTDVAAELLVKKYMVEILNNSREEREAYFSYMENIGISGDITLAVADIGMKGTIQYSLQRILKKDILGYYITGVFGQGNPYGMDSNTDALFPIRENGEESWVYRYFILLESVFVAPEGMYLYAKKDGGFVNAPQKKNQQNYAAKKLVHEGINGYFSDWLQAGLSITDSMCSNKLVDAVFSQVMGNSVNIEEGIKAVFSVDECYKAESEKLIWD